MKLIQRITCQQLKEGSPSPRWMGLAHDYYDTGDRLYVIIPFHHAVHFARSIFFLYQRYRTRKPLWSRSIDEIEWANTQSARNLQYIDWLEREIKSLDKKICDLESKLEKSG